jgi:hypothetical protein
MTMGPFQRSRKRDRVDPEGQQQERLRQAKGKAAQDRAEQNARAGDGPSVST